MTAQDNDDFGKVLKTIAFDEFSMVFSSRTESYQQMSLIKFLMKGNVRIKSIVIPEERITESNLPEEFHKDEKIVIMMEKFQDLDIRLFKSLFTKTRPLNTVLIISNSAEEDMIDFLKQDLKARTSICVGSAVGRRTETAK